MKLAVSSLLLLLAILATAMAQESCPDEVDLSVCGVDPCEGQMCPRFYNAECRPNLCFGGLCTPNFFFGNSNVTGRCTVQTCDTRTCPGTRQCMEEVRPAACPPERPNCRQALHTRCFLPPVVDRPMTCMDMDCIDGEVCRMRLRGDDFPPVVNCWPPERVSDCVPGTCNAGLECVDDGPSVRCMPPPTNTTSPSPTTPTTSPSTAPPTTPTAPPTTPTAPPTTAPPITTCADLPCAQLGLLCQENQTGADCVAASTCEELAPVCESTDRICEIMFGFPFCREATSCDQLSCGPLERCGLRSVPGFQGIPTCIDTRFGLRCESLTCEFESDECLISTITGVPNTTLAQCIDGETAALITRTTCERNPNFCTGSDICIELLEDGLAISPYCLQPNCQQGGCPTNFTCQTGLTNAPFSSACTLSNISFSLGTTCATRVLPCPTNQVCQEAALSDETILGSFCGESVNRTCLGVECREDEICVTSYINEFPVLTVAACVRTEDYFNSLFFYQNVIFPPVGTTTPTAPPTTPTAPPTTPTAPPTTPTAPPTTPTTPPITTCEDLGCAQLGLLCQENRTGAVCVPASSCEELAPICESTNTICEDSFGVPFCTQPTRCDQISCGPLERCGLRSVPGFQGLPTCIDTRFGLRCESLTCEFESDECLVSTITGVTNTTVAQCIDGETAALITRTSCDTNPNFCTAPDICIDLFEDGITISPFCLQPNCQPGGCPTNFTCLTGLTNALFSSACTLSNISFSLGTTCATRSLPCPTNQVCQESALDGTTLGSFCGESANRTCLGVECREDEICVDSYVSEFPRLTAAACVRTEDYFNLLFLYQNVIFPPVEPTTPTAQTTLTPGTPSTFTNTTTATPFTSSPAPTPSGRCEQLMCGQSSQICIEDENGTRCVPASSCEELAPFCAANFNTFSTTCDESFGFPLCVPPTDCNQVTCNELERCMLVEAPDFGITTSIAICLLTTVALSCDELICPTGFDQCQLFSIPNELNSTLAVCSIGRLTCENAAEFLCGPDEVCVDLTQDGRIYAPFCTRINCEMTGCPTNFTCVSDILNGPSSSVCTPLDTPISFETNCETRGMSCAVGTVCQEAVFNDTIIGTFCGEPVPMSCEEQTCSSDEMCLLSMFRDDPASVEAVCQFGDTFLTTLSLYQGVLVIPGPSSGSGSGFTSGSGSRLISGSGSGFFSGSGSGLFPTCDQIFCGFFERCGLLTSMDPFVEEYPICIDTRFGLTCESLTCEFESDECLISNIPGVPDTTVAQCIDGETAALITRTSCDTNPNFCTGSDICIDLFEDGITISPFCLQPNCQPGGCPTNFTCLTGFTNAPFSSACTLSNISFSLGTTCATRILPCPTNQVCQEAALNGTTVGSYCGESVNRTCRGVECRGDEMCVTSYINEFPRLTVAACIRTEDYFNLLFLHQNAVFPPVEPTAPPITTCEDLGCAQLGLLCQENQTGAVCVPASSCEELAPICESTNNICEDSFGVPFCTQPTRCDQISCGPLERCGLFPVPSAGGFPTCIDTRFGLRCESLMCEFESDECIISTTTGITNTTAAQCIDGETAALITRTSCDTNPNFCMGSDICIDLFEDGLTISPFCLQPNCQPGGCPTNFTCHTGLTNAPFSSACTLSNISFSLGTTCATRILPCPTNQVCQEAALSGTTLGSFCGESANRTCLGVECREDEICVTSYVSEFPQPTVAACVRTEDYFNLLFLYQNVIFPPVETTTPTAQTTLTPGTPSTFTNTTTATPFTSSPTPTPSGLCEELMCGQSSQICIEDENGARCVPPSSCEELAPFCAANTDTFSTACDESFGFPLCVPPTDCNQVTCNELEHCMLVEAPDFGITTSIAICLPTTVALSCDELICPTGFDQCQLFSIPNELNSTLAVCSIGRLTCENAAGVLCGPDEVCVDLTQDGRTYAPFCTRINCEMTGCPTNFTCISDILNGPSSSVCTPLDTPISFETNCETRGMSCAVGTVCQEAVFNDNIIGTFCGEPVPTPVLSCEEQTCSSDEVCLLSMLRDDPASFEAVCQSDVFLTTLSLYQGVLLIPEPSSGSGSGFFSGSGSRFFSGSTPLR